MAVSKMSVTLLKQQLIDRGLPTTGLKPALEERLRQAMNKNPNAEFHSLTSQAASEAKEIADKEKESQEVCQGETIDKLLVDQARLTATEDAIAEAKIRQIETQKKLKELVRSFTPDLGAAVNRGSARKESWRVCCLGEAGVERCGGDGQGAGTVPDHCALRRRGRRESCRSR